MKILFVCGYVMIAEKPESTTRGSQEGEKIQHGTTQFTYSSSVARTIISSSMKPRAKISDGDGAVFATGHKEALASFFGVLWLMNWGCDWVACPVITECGNCRSPLATMDPYPCQCGDWMFRRGLNLTFNMKK